MAKDCTDCVEAIKGCWEDGNNYCYRDKEEISPERIDVSGLNEFADKVGFYSSKKSTYFPKR